MNNQDAHLARRISAIAKDGLERRIASFMNTTETDVDAFAVDNLEGDSYSTKEYRFQNNVAINTRMFSAASVADFKFATFLSTINTSAEQMHWQPAFNLGQRDGSGFPRHLFDLMAALPIEQSVVLQKRIMYALAARFPLLDELCNETICENNLEEKSGVNFVSTLRICDVWPHIHDEDRDFVVNIIRQFIVEQARFTVFASYVERFSLGAALVYKTMLKVAACAIQCAIRRFKIHFSRCDMDRAMVHMDCGRLATRNTPFVAWTPELAQQIVRVIASGDDVNSLHAEWCTMLANCAVRIDVMQREIHAISYMQDAMHIKDRTPWPIFDSFNMAVTGRPWLLYTDSAEPALNMRAFNPNRKMDGTHSRTFDARTLVPEMLPETARPASIKWMATYTLRNMEGWCPRLSTPSNASCINRHMTMSLETYFNNNMDRNESPCIKFFTKTLDEPVFVARNISTNERIARLETYQSNAQRPFQHWSIYERRYGASPSEAISSLLSWAAMMPGVFFDRDTDEEIDEIDDYYTGRVRYFNTRFAGTIGPGFDKDLETTNESGVPKRSRVKAKGPGKRLLYFKDDRSTSKYLCLNFNGRQQIGTRQFDITGITRAINAAFLDMIGPLNIASNDAIDVALSSSGGKFSNFAKNIEHQAYLSLFDAFGLYVDDITETHEFSRDALETFNAAADALEDKSVFKMLCNEIGIDFPGFGLGDKPHDANEENNISKKYYAVLELVLNERRIG